MESTSPTITQQHLLNDAILYAQGSEFATLAHERIGYALGVEVALTKNAKWTELGAHAVASALDWADGRLKNMAVKSGSRALFKNELNNRDDNNKPDEKQWKVLNTHGIVDNPRGDERTDKRYFYSLMIALAVRMARTGDTQASKRIATNVAVSKARDNAKGGLRDYAEARGWSTNAKFLGKAKTFLHGAGIAVLLTPPLDNKIGHKIGTTIITAGTIVGGVDYCKYNSDISEQERLADKI